jgi:hypothetical protein
MKFCEDCNNITYCPELHEGHHLVSVVIQEHEISAMLDVVANESPLEVQISHHGDRVWINYKNQCIARFCKIKELIVTDDRYPDALGEGEERTVNAIVHETSQDIKINYELEKIRDQKDYE